MAKKDYRFERMLAVEIIKAVAQDAGVPGNLIFQFNPDDANDVFSVGTEVRLYQGDRNNGWGPVATVDIGIDKAVVMVADVEDIVRHEATERYLESPVDIPSELVIDGDDYQELKERAETMLVSPGRPPKERIRRIKVRRAFHG